VVSLLILAIGLLPFVENQIGQRLTPNPNTVYPIYETSIALPLSYYAFMKVLQILQVRSVETLKKGDLVASKALESAISQTVKDEFAHALAHRWAIYIHGKILTRLAATALKLEMAAQVNDISTYRSTVESLKSLLSHPTSEFDTESGDLQSQIASRLDPWLGLLEVDLFIDPSLHTLNNHRVLSVGEVIEEIVSNSMRHGKAHKISLRVMKQGERDIHITAVDDGDTPPPEQPTRYGLGTTIFNLVSDGRWSITRIDSQTEFNLVMSIE
jgi:two-component sensor histidine kinase